MSRTFTTMMFHSSRESHQSSILSIHEEAIMNPQEMTIQTLRRRSAQELSHFFSGRYADVRFGYELFRRALEEQEQMAWMAVVEVYETLVLRWVHQHPKFPLVDEESHYFVNRAFERLWRNVALKPGKFRQFETLPAIFQFLKMCVYAAVIDDGLKLPPSEMMVTPFPDDDELKNAKMPSIKMKMTQQINRNSFWQVIDSNLKTEQEKIVMYGFFLSGMKPREIYAQHRQAFQNAKQVSNVKTTVLRRLARIPSFEETLRDFIDDDYSYSQFVMPTYRGW